MTESRVAGRVSTRRWRPWCKRFALVAAAAMWTIPALGAETSGQARSIRVENVRLGFDATSAKGAINSFKIGSWTTVWATAVCGPEAFDGVVELSASDDDGMPVAQRLPLALAAGESRPLTFYARPGARDPSLHVRFIDRAGRVRGSFSQGTFLRESPRPIKPGETLILTAGNPSGVETIVDLPGFRPGGQGTTDVGMAEFLTAALDVRGERIPDRWLGYDGVMGFVLDSSDRALLDALNGPRGRALIDWVDRGGHLVVAIGREWQAVQGSVLGPILPCVPTGRERVSSLEAIDTFAGTTHSITPPDTPAVQVTRLDQVNERGGVVLSIASRLPLVVRGTHGFGRITVVAIDVDEKPFTDWAERGLFWAKALDLRRRRIDPNAAAKFGGGSARLFQSGARDVATQLKNSLEQFSGVALVSFGSIAVLIFVYIALIGPIDYLFLKKVLRRMELTWITFPAVVIVTSLAAYYTAFLLKGNELIINQLEVIDVDQTANDFTTRGTTWFSLFSPQNHDYDVTVTPALSAPNANPGDSSTAAPGQIEVITSWFNAPEDRFGAMGSSSRRFSFGGEYAYAPAGQFERLENVRVPIWSTKAFATQWYGPGKPMLEANLSPVGADRLSGVITNRLDTPMEDAILAFGRQVYVLGKLEPRVVKRVELTYPRSLSGYLHSRQEGYLPQVQSSREKPINRVDLLVAAMFHDSEATAAGEPPLTSDALHHLDLTGQLALSRPMLVARVATPGTDIKLDDATAKPKRNTLTMVRLLLPLSRTPS